MLDSLAVMHDHTISHNMIEVTQLMKDGYWSDPDRADNNTKLLWNTARQEKLVYLWEQDIPAEQIGKELGVTKRSVQRYVAKNRDRLGLQPRYGRLPAGRPHNTFEKEWYGPVPFGHWALTKPWKLTK